MNTSGIHQMPPAPASRSKPPSGRLCPLAFVLLALIWPAGAAAPEPDAFQPGASREVLAWAVQADGKVLVGGVSTNVGGASRLRLARLHADGTLDASFDPGANGTVQALAVQADGGILVGGQFSSLGGQSRARLARVEADSTLAQAHASLAAGSGRALPCQPGQPIRARGCVVGGYANSSSWFVETIFPPPVILSQSVHLADGSSRLTSADRRASR